MDKREAQRLKKEVSARRPWVMRSAWRRRSLKRNRWRESQGWRQVSLWVPAAAVSELRERIKALYGEPPKMPRDNGDKIET